jgi:hypothetical protein
MTDVKEECLLTFGSTMLPSEDRTPDHHIHIQEEPDILVYVNRRSESVHVHFVIIKIYFFIIFTTRQWTENDCKYNPSQAVATVSTSNPFVSFPPYDVAARMAALANRQLLSVTIDTSSHLFNLL